MAPMADEQTGGMIALIPRESDAAALAVPRGDKPEEMHLTLVYLGGDVTGMDSRQRNAIAAAVANVAVMLPPVETRVFAHATFNPDGHGDREPCAVYLIGDSTVLGPLRAELAQFGGDDQHEPFVPHVTAGYGLKQSKLTFTGPVVFDRLRVALAGDHYDFPLGEPMQKGMHMLEHLEIKRRRAQPVAATITTVSELRREIARHPGVADKAEHKVLVIRSAQELDAVNLLPEVWTKAVADDLALHSSEETIEEWGAFESKVMSPNPNAAKLREYWVGQFGKKWRKFRQLRRHLAKYVQNPKILNGLTANIYKLATGTWPGRRGGDKGMPVITAEEFKAAMLMADPDADFDLMADDFGSLAPEDDEDDLDAEGDASDEETAYEQALADDFIWSINADGELERDDDAPVDDEDAEDETVPPGPRSVGEAYSLF
jgi:hypothetical protein